MSTALLAFAIRALLRGDLVPGAFYKAAIAERDESRKAAADAVEVSKKLVAGWKPPQ
jgi:hypothetical protein